MVDAYLLAERVAPSLATLAHPGDGAGIKPGPLNLCGLFGPYEFPEGISDTDREAMGVPSPEFPRMFLEALFSLIQREFAVEFIDSRDLADLQAAAAQQTLKPNQPVEVFLNNEKIARLTVHGYDFTKLHITPDQLQALAVIAQKKA